MRWRISTFRFGRSRVLWGRVADVGLEGLILGYFSRCLSPRSREVDRYLVISIHWYRIGSEEDGGRRYYDRGACL